MEKPQKTPKKGKSAGAPRAKQVRESGVSGGARIGRRNIVLFVAGLAAIVLGYTILSLGGESLGAILLVGGYLGLVPWAILVRDRDGQKVGGPSGAGART